MTSPGRKYQIGNAVIWTAPSNGMRHPGTIRGYVEPEPGDDYDQAASGPLYDVQLEPGQHWEMQVAETDLSPSDGKEAPPPPDPFSSHDAERIAKHVGGQVLGAVSRVGKDKLTIGAFEHPHKARWLNTVTIRMYDLDDGKQTNAVDLSADEVFQIVEWLRAAAQIAWGQPEPDPAPKPPTSWDDPPPYDDDDEA